MPSFVTDSDLYRPFAELTPQGRYALWRYLTHIVDWAPRNPAWAARLRAIDCSRLPKETLALLRATLEYSTSAVKCLTPQQASWLLRAKPVVPACRITTSPAHLKIYANWGFII